MPGKLIVDEIEDSGGTSVIGRKNYIINGNFDIWQRGTSGTSGYCSADRWVYENSGTTGTFAQGTFTLGQTDVPNNPRYFANLTVTGADDNAALTHRIEDVVTLAAETATVSFYYKHTTNAPTNFDVVMYQIFGTGGSTFTTTNISTGNTTTTSWQKFTGTFTLPSVSGKTSGAGNHIKLAILNPNNETFDIQIAQVQVEKGSVATDFEVRPIAEEQSLCNRYYQIYIEGFQGIATGAMYNSTTVLGVINFEEMRVAPSLEVVTGTNYYRFWRNNTSDDFNDFAFSGAIGKKSLRLQSNTNLSGTAGQCGTIEGYHANAKMALDAEL